MRFSRQFTRVKPGRGRLAAEGDSPPDLGQVSELIRDTLSDKYDIYPPNLSTSINQDGSILIVAVNPETGLNLQVTLQNMRGDFVHPNGQMTGVVPPANGQPPMADQGVPPM